jgi:hypothetical protein
MAKSGKVCRRDSDANRAKLLELRALEQAITDEVLVSGFHGEFAIKGSVTDGTVIELRKVVEARHR